MPSRLSSLLVRDGLVGVDRMEHVFQRQVIYGGSLDTILLEMKLIGEEHLQQYLSLATGLPSAEEAELEAANGTAKDACNEQFAVKHGVVPIAVDDGALRVLVCDPVDLDKLESLANDLDLAVQPLVVPEFRFQLQFARTYGATPDARFEKVASLAKELVLVPQGAPVEASPEDGVPREIEPENTRPADTSERVRGKRPKKEQPERRATMELTTEALREHLEATKALAGDAPKVVIDPAELPGSMKAALDQVAEVEADANPAGPLRPAAARTALGRTDDRDQIFEVLLRALRYRTSYSALLTVQSGSAIGRMALSGDEIDRDHIKSVTIPLDVPSPFKQVVSSKSFHIGKLETDDEILLAQFAHFGGGEIPVGVLLLPIVIGNRVVAIAVGHCYGQALSVADVTELLPLANSATDALSRVLARKKAAKGQGGEASGSAGDSVASDPALLELFAKLEGDGREAAIEALLARRDDCLAHLEQSFPGPLTINRHDAQGKMRAAQHGPCLDLLTRIGSKAGDLLADKMRDADRETRFYATLCAAELRAASVLNAFVERLFDGDPEIRTLAIDALKGYPFGELNAALDFARRALHSEDNERVRAAANGLANLGDVNAVSDLIDAHSRGGEVAEVSRSALQEITNQDFGNSTRKWRAWWTKNQHRSRIEWMLDGLSHKNAELRKVAAETLRELTGESFGYQHDLPKKEREEARQKWLQWWESSGKQRFDRKSA